MAARGKERPGAALPWPQAGARELSPAAPAVPGGGQAWAARGVKDGGAGPAQPGPARGSRQQAASVGAGGSFLAASEPGRGRAPKALRPLKPQAGWRVLAGSTATLE